MRDCRGALDVGEEEELQKCATTVVKKFRVFKPYKGYCLGYLKPRHIVSLYASVIKELRHIASVKKKIQIMGQRKWSKFLVVFTTSVKKEPRHIALVKKNKIKLWVKASSQIFF